MPYPRSKTISKTFDGHYHFTSKCVRDAYLLNPDNTKEHKRRKKWIIDKMIFLSQIFYIGVDAYAVMDNHMHIVVETKYTIADSASEKDIAFRWLYLHPKKKDKLGFPIPPTKEEINKFISDKTEVENTRAKLRDPSTYMKELNQSIAKKINKEDGKTGRFWRGRFNSVYLPEERAVLKCMVYVDLNEIRAKIAKSPECSKFSSCYRRIKAKLAREELKENPNNEVAKEESKLDNWLEPVFNTKKKYGFLNISLNEYITILDLTGREIREDKRGSISEDLEPILKRVGLKSEKWVETFLSFEKDFKRVAGSEDAIRKQAEKANKHWFQGVGLANKHFI